ncbi:MAG: hypothetical protein Q7R52_04380 [archaeon]|nr:hypothetical protein [archaeon]
MDNITDPVSAARPSDSKFVVSSYPLRTTFFPLITIRSDGFEEIQASGFRSELMWVRLTFAIRVWARNEVEKEKLTEQLLNELRQAQYDGGSSFSDDEGLHDLRIESIISVDEQDENGVAGIRSNIIRINFKFMYGA